MNHWSGRYIGIPHVEFGRGFDGADCWGVPCLVYQHELGIELPTYVSGYVSEDERAELAGIIDNAAASPIWAPVEGLAMPFDIVIFRRGAIAAHVGLVVHDGLMLHSARQDNAKIESYRGGMWAHRLIGTYRHRKLLKTP